MATNEILTFASTVTGTNLLTQAEYSTDAQRTIGHQSGVARSKLANKAMRQVSAIASGVAQFMADSQVNNITDTLTTQNIADYLSASIKNSSFQAGTRLMFAQASAPTGWTQVTTDEANNRMLRVVSGTGGATNGTHSPILNNVVPAHTHGFTTGVESSSHTHTASTSVQSADHTHEYLTPLRQFYGDYDRGGGLSTWSIDNVGYYQTGTQSTDHTHVVTVASNTQTHTHSGATDNGSSETNWTPRYIDMILCAKN
jgi:hypothetical protein